MLSISKVAGMEATSIGVRWLTGSGSRTQSKGGSDWNWWPSMLNTRVSLGSFRFHLLLVRETEKRQRAGTLATSTRNGYTAILRRMISGI